MLNKKNDLNYDRENIFLFGKNENGKVVNYDVNGKVLDVIEYKNGAKNGLCEKYHTTGYIREMGKYEDNERKGLWLEYDMKGNLIDTKRYA